MPRLSITLTESQAAALERIAAETGATKQSMIGLAVTSWIRQNDLEPNSAPKAPESALQRSYDDFTPTPTTCEVCGEEAIWASMNDDGIEHYFCDRHQMSDLAQR